MKHLRPEQIFVMDNATFLDPPDNTREVLAEADLHEVNYSEYRTAVGLYYYWYHYEEVDEILTGLSSLDLPFFALPW